MITHAFFTRRKLLRSAASASLASGASLAESGRMPPYTLSANIEIMFPKTMPRHERMEVVAALGMKAFSFWGVGSEEEKAMLAVQKRTGLRCASIAGSGRIGWTTGLTKPKLSLSRVYGRSDCYG